MNVPVVSAAGSRDRGCYHGCAMLAHTLLGVPGVVSIVRM
jgi:hypothetical protein